MPTPIDAATDTALIVLPATEICPEPSSVSTKACPSGASSDQVCPATRVVSFSFSTRIHFDVSV